VILRELPIRVFRSLRHKNYAFFWSSDLIASVGQFVREVALYWLAYEIIGSAWALGILRFCEAAPWELLGRVMSVFLMDQGMRSLGSMVMGAFVAVFGAALGLALTSLASMILTAVTFWRLLRTDQK
jgi:hypothetical protein